MKFKEQIKELQRSIDERRLRVSALKEASKRKYLADGQKELIASNLSECESYIKGAREAIKVLKGFKNGI